MVCYSQRRRFLFFLLIVISILTQACLPMKIPTIYDGQKYGVKEIQLKGKKKKLKQLDRPIPDENRWMLPKYHKKYEDLEVLLKKSNTTSFLVLKDGKVLYENYFNGVEQGDITQVFSVTKVITTAVLGIAIQEGKIQSINQPVSDFIPAFKEEGLEDITLFHLVQMQSGLAYDEYKRIFQTLKFYHQKDVRSRLNAPKLKHTPGEKFIYKSIDTQLLGVCIEQAVGVPFSEYVSQMLFSPLGFEDPVQWSVDSKENGQLKYYGGLNISARDLAKFAQLFLSDGRVGEQQVLSPMTVSFCKDNNCRNNEGAYCNGWWYNVWDDDRDVFFGAGFKGQIMMINHTDDVVIVRLGENKGGVKWYEMLKNLSVEIGKMDKEYKVNTEHQVAHSK